MKFEIHVKYIGPDWGVYRNKILLRKMYNQEKAIIYARKTAKNAEGEMIVYTKKGAVKRNYNYSQTMAKKSKYNNKIVVFEGITFHSIAEKDRYCELLFMVRAKEISDLVLQPKFLLQDKFVDSMGGKHDKLHYIGDFQYINKTGKIVVEDVKGKKTEVYNIKKKLFCKKILGVNVDIFMEVYM